MSILIKGMEMPKAGDTILIAENCDGTFYGRVENDCNSEWFQLIPIPPHGRLIDADAYEKLLQGLGNRDYRREKGTICDAIKFLHSQYTPTVIDAEAEGKYEK